MKSNSTNANKNNKASHQSSLTDFFSYSRKRKRQEIMEENSSISDPVVHVAQPRPHEVSAPTSDCFDSPLLSALANVKNKEDDKPQMKKSLEYQDILDMDVSVSENTKTNLECSDKFSESPILSQEGDRAGSSMETTEDGFKDFLAAVANTIEPVERNRSKLASNKKRKKSCKESDLFKIYDDDEDHSENEMEWGGVDKRELRSLVPASNEPIVRDLNNTESQCVLFKDCFTNDQEIEFVDMWRTEYVRLPCSKHNFYPVEKHGVKQLVNRWDLIQTSLLSDIKNSCELQESILKYNNRFEGEFKSLNTYFLEEIETSEANDFFDNVLPKMIDLALQLPKIVPKPIPLLLKQNQKTLFLSQRQIACLLANAFLCTFPRRNSKGRNSEYGNFPSINFNAIFEKSNRTKAHMEKIKTLLHYFKRITTKMPNGVVSFERRVLSDFPLWNQSPCPIGKAHFAKDGLIEDQINFSQVDFANKFVGGGVLRSGLVQEEIRFIICPELIISRLFTECLENNECLVVKGVERFSDYKGYASSYRWSGNHDDQTTFDRHGRRNTEILIIDATSFHKSEEQYRPGKVLRELNKAFCGFYCGNDPDNAPALATGNWGCGAFSGDPQLKCVIQLMAAAVLGRDICYLTFQDGKSVKILHDMYRFIKDKHWTVADLWDLISKYNKEVSSTAKTSDFYNFMLTVSSSYDSSTDTE